MRAKAVAIFGCLAGFLVGACNVDVIRATGAEINPPGKSTPLATPQAPAPNPTGDSSTWAKVPANRAATSADVPPPPARDFAPTGPTDGPTDEQPTPPAPVVSAPPAPTTPAPSVPVARVKRTVTSEASGPGLIIENTGSGNVYVNSTAPTSPPAPASAPAPLAAPAPSYAAQPNASALTAILPLILTPAEIQTAKGDVGRIRGTIHYLFTGQCPNAPAPTSPPAPASAPAPVVAPAYAYAFPYSAPVQAAPMPTPQAAPAPTPAYAVPLTIAPAPAAPKKCRFFGLGK